MNVRPSPLAWFWISAGWICLALATLGIFLPVLPTTPFVLLAAYCFSKGSRRLHAWLRRHPHFGPLIENWERHGAIRRAVKITATLLIVPLFGYSCLFLPLTVVWKVPLVLTGLGVVIFIWSRPDGPRLKPALGTPEASGHSDDA